MRKKLLVISLVLLAAVLLSACTGQARANTWPGLAADENMAYLSHINLVYGIKMKDGTEAWRFSDKDDNKALFYAQPALTPDGLVVVGSAAGKYKLYALDPQNTSVEDDSSHPAVKWTFTGAESPWSAAPLVVDNLLFAPNSDGNLYVLDLNDGQIQKQPVKVVPLGGQLWAQPVTDGERVFVSSIEHTVSAIDIKTFDVIWQDNVNAAVPGSPAIGSDGMLYVGSLASELEQFDPKTGNHKSVLDAKNWIWGAPTVSGESLYFGDLDGYLYSYNTADDVLNWSIQPDSSNDESRSITANVFAGEDIIVVATESGNIYAVDEAGAILWPKDVGGKIYTTPVAAGDLFLVAPLETDFFLTALDKQGRQVWNFAPER
jgi:outer membrane protein assembly factor BamB